MAEPTVHYTRKGRILCDGRELCEIKRPQEDWVEGNQVELVNCPKCRHKLDEEQEDAGRKRKEIIEFLADKPLIICDDPEENARLDEEITAELDRLEKN